MVALDTDWAENLTISKARLLQSQYYNLVQCSLLISVVQFLDKSAWEDRDSALEAGNEVTVQDSNGAFWARVVGPTDDGYRLRTQV